MDHFEGVKSFDRWTDVQITQLWAVQMAPWLVPDLEEKKKISRNSMEGAFQITGSLPIGVTCMFLCSWSVQNKNKIK